MKELIDFNNLWKLLIAKCHTNIGITVLIVLAFLSGMALKEKTITDDCKFMGTFRDGAYSYNCSARIR